VLRERCVIAQETWLDTQNGSGAAGIVINSNFLGIDASETDRVGGMQKKKLTTHDENPPTYNPA